MRMLKNKNKNWEDEANLKFSRQELNILWTAMFRSHAPYHITNNVCSREQNKKFPEQSYLTSPCFKTLVLVQPCDKTVFSCVKKKTAADLHLLIRNHIKRFATHPGIIRWHLLTKWDIRYQTMSIYIICQCVEHWTLLSLLTNAIIASEKHGHVAYSI